MKKAMLIMLAAIIFSALGAQTEASWSWVQHFETTENTKFIKLTESPDGFAYAATDFTGSMDYMGSRYISRGYNDILVFKTDPLNAWVAQAGGTGGDFVKAITSDSQGNVYITGHFSGTAYFGNIPLVQPIVDGFGQMSIFVAKLDINGNWVWAVQAHGNDVVQPYGITVDQTGAVYICGRHSYTMFWGGYSITAASRYSSFVAKVNSNGELGLIHGFGGAFINEWDEAYAISSDSENNIIVGGSYFSSAYFGSIHLVSNGYYDAYIAKMSPSGQWLWARTAGGNLSDTVTALKVDSEGSIIVCGAFRNTSQFGEISLIMNTNDGFQNYIAKLDNDGNWQWVRRTNASSACSIWGIGIDENRNIHISGHYQGSLSHGDFTLPNRGVMDIFVSKMTTDGDWLWSVSAGGEGVDGAQSVACGSDGKVYVSGTTEGEAYFGNLQYPGGYYEQCYVAQLSPVPVSNDDHGAGSVPMVSLKQNFPNPFNPKTGISFTLAQAGNVSLEVYNVKGQKVKTLLSDYKNAGEHRLEWNGTDDMNRPQSSGIYYYRLINAQKTISKKMILLK